MNLILRSVVARTSRSRSFRSLFSKKKVSETPDFVEYLELPPSVTHVSFDESFSSPVPEFPPNLTYIKFGRAFCEVFVFFTLII